MKLIKDKNKKLAFVTLVNKLIFVKDNNLIPLLKSLKKVDSKEEVAKIEKIEENLEKQK